MKPSLRAALLMLLSCINTTPLIAGDDSPVSYHRDVLPVFRTNCIACHKPGKLKGGLDLTSFAALIKGGDEGPTIKAGDAAASRLFETICGDEPEMPKDSEPLLPREIDLIRRWIDQGAAIDEPVDTFSRRPADPPSYNALPAVHALAFSPDGKWLAVPGRHEILLHRADGSGIAARLLGDSPRLESLAFSRDGTLLVASGGAVSEFGEIQIWDVANRDLVRSIKGSHDAFYGVSISPDNRQVAVGCADKLIRVFNVGDGTEAMRCDNHLDWVFGSAFTNDGLRLATASRDKAAKLIDIATGHLIDDINRSRDPLICLARHPIDDLLATGGTEGKIRLFRMEPRGGRLAEGDNKEESFVREYKHMGAPIQSVAFSPDGSAVACSAANGDVRIFQTENGQRVSQIKAQQGPVYAIAFSADGNQIACGGQDGQIRFYNATDGQQVQEVAIVAVE
jgi:WD40 repeat protein/mono/diheme cytochrome c family protein